MHRRVFSGHRLAVGAAIAVSSILGSCGGTLYAVEANSAASRLEQAKALGAERYAPYEYYFAEAHLLKAMEEAAAADYGDARELAITAETYAVKAITLARRAHEGAGR